MTEGQEGLWAGSGSHPGVFSEVIFSQEKVSSGWSGISQSELQFHKMLWGMKSVVHNLGDNFMPFN